MTVGVPKETAPGETRAALVPTAIAQLKKSKIEVVVETEVGVRAGFPDAAYMNAGAEIAPDRSSVIGRADIVIQHRILGAYAEGFAADLPQFRAGQSLIGIADAQTTSDPVREAAKVGITTFALELIPRITRAQAMDVLSSQASIAGYKAVLLAASTLPKLFPMMMTAAGTITPSRVFVIGGGVAGLQAIATARRLGAVVSAYDVRPAVKEQAESLGARFVDLGVGGMAEGTGGYAKEMDREFYDRQAELMAGVIADNDVVISTAAVPGKRAPVIITRPMVERMQPGSVIVDVAAERGGNCELTQPGLTIQHDGVTIIGPLSLATGMPYHASQLFAKNATTFLLNMVNKEGNLSVNLDDEIVRETLLTQGGEVVHPRIRELLDMPTTAAGAPRPEADAQ